MVLNYKTTDKSTLNKENIIRNMAVMVMKTP